MLKMSRTFNADPSIDPATAKLISQLRADVFDELTKKDAQVKTNPRQYIINPDFRFWLDNDGLAAGTGGRYSSTLYYFDSSGNSVSVTKESHEIGQSDVPSSSPYYAQVDVADDAGVSSLAVFTLPCEDVRNFSDKDQIISIWCKASSGTPYICLEGYQLFGSGGSPSAGVSAPTKKIKINSSWNRYDIPIKWPSISGKTIGTDANSSCVIINIWLSSGSDYNARNDTLGHQAITIDVGLVTLYDGTEIQNYSERSVQEEMNLIGRYYRKMTYLRMYGVGDSYRSTQISRFGTNLIPAMRTTPKLDNPIAITVYDGTIASNIPIGSFSTPAANYSTSDIIELDVLASGVVTVGRIIETYQNGLSWHVIARARYFE